MALDSKTSWKKHFELPVGVSLSAQRQIEVMTAKLGSTPERNLSFRCEFHLPTYDQALFLGQSIDSSPSFLFSAVQQVIAKADVLEAEFNRQITFRLSLKRWFAPWVREAVGTHLIVPRAVANCRLLTKLLLRYHPGWYIRPMRLAARMALANSLRRDLFAIKRIAEKPLPIPEFGDEPD